MESVHQRGSRIVPSSADWAHLRPIVKELYHDRHWTMVQVRDYLELIGFRVNKRMVRARITQWNLQRNNQVRDMAAALRLLDPNPNLWPSPEPSFLIRGRTVTVTEVLHFFRRKGIQNPITWARSNPVDRENPDVTLLDTETASETTPINPHITPVSRRQSPTIQSISLPVQLLTLEQKAVTNLHNYCLAYVGQGYAAAQQEPQVHQFTIHGRFGDRMQEGLAHMIRGGPDAFPNFRRGFDLVQDLLSDCHPMSLALFLAVSCELAAHNALPVLSSLLRYSATMASSLRISSPVTEFLLALRSSQDVLRVAISSLRAALGAFNVQQTTHWQRLYVQERLCDCLYHGKERTEGSWHRAGLFLDQEEFYGPSARNVLWTLTNVADDQLHLGNLDSGKAHFKMALKRAENLTGFGRAKIRFAALEGLARTAQMRVEEISRDPLAITPESVGPYLQEAYEHIDDALNEASIWFEPSSRRVSRVAERRRQILTLMTGLEHNTPLESRSVDDDLSLT